MKKKRVISIFIIIMIAICTVTVCIIKKSSFDPVLKAAKKYNVDFDRIRDDVFYNFDGRTEVVLPSNRELNICFIGNSLTYAGNMFEYLDRILMQHDKHVNVTKINKDGAELQDLCKVVKENDLEAQKIKDADVVVLQEHGTKYENTENSIDELLTYCKSDCKVYFWIAELQMFSELELTVNQYPNIIPLPIGYAVNQLMMYDLFQFEDLHEMGDYHPNNLGGYFEALVLYHSFYGENVEGFVYSFISQNEMSKIPGTDESEIKVNMQLAQRIIDIYCKWYVPTNRVTKESKVWADYFEELELN